MRLAIMRLAIIRLAVIAFALGLAGAAQAQTWQSIDARQSDLDRRIDAGVQEGQITRDEAAHLRDDFRQLLTLQDSFRANGLNAGERRELDQRFEALSDRVRAERHDREANTEGQTQSPTERMAQTQQRIGEGESGGALSRTQAATLNAEARDIGALRARYAAGGLTVQERAGLDRRFDALDDKIRRGEVIRMAAGRR